MYQVRIVLPTATLDLISHNEPGIIGREVGAEVSADWVTGGAHAGDKPAFIDWAKVIAVTWRQAPEHHRISEMATAHCRDNVLNAMEPGRPTSPKELARLLGLNADTVRVRLGRLVKRGQAIKLRHGTYCLPVATAIGLSAQLTASEGA